MPNITSNNKTIQNSSMFERFRCAGAMMFRGVVAPVVHPLAGAFDLASESLVDRNSLLLNVASNGTGVCFSLVLGAIAGLVTGVGTFANSLVEAPYQLVCSSRPQSRPWLERKIINSAHPQSWTWVDRKLLGLRAGG